MFLRLAPAHWPETQFKKHGYSETLEYTDLLDKASEHPDQVANIMKSFQPEYPCFQLKC